MGLLENLSPFLRDKRTILPVGSVADHPCVIRSPKIRQIINSVTVAAQHANGKQELNVRLEPTLWKRRDELLPKFFRFTVEITDRMYSIAKLMHTLFNVSSSRIGFNSNEHGNDSDDDDGVRRNTFRVQFQILDNTLRQTVVSALDRLLALHFLMKGQ